MMTSNGLLAPLVSLKATLSHAEPVISKSEERPSTPTTTETPSLSSEVPSSLKTASLDDDTLRSRTSFFHSTAEKALSRVNSDIETIRSRNQEDEISAEEALVPDKMSEQDFEIEDNPFAFSPGQLDKLLNPKSVTAFRALVASGVLHDLERGSKTDNIASIQQRATYGSDTRFPLLDHAGGRDKYFDATSYAMVSRASEEGEDSVILYDETEKTSAPFSDTVYGFSVQENHPMRSKTAEQSKALHGAQSQAHMIDAVNRPHVDEKLEVKVDHLESERSDNPAGLPSSLPDIFGEHWKRYKRTYVEQQQQSEDLGPELFGGRLTRKSVRGLPRLGTFRRQNSERRERLTPVESPTTERRTPSFSGPRALSAQPLPPAPNPIAKTSTTVFECSSSNDPTFSNEPAPPPLPLPKPFNYGDMTDEIREDLEKKWIYNLSLHFRNDLPREKFFITYAETPQRWRRITISCDYQSSPPESLEQDLQALSSQRDKSARIYEAIRESLPEIQFYDTVTNLRLETEDDRLHVHVTEDIDEIDYVLPGSRPTDTPLMTIAANDDRKVLPTVLPSTTRRGRGKRRNDAYWKDYNSELDKDPFDRECLFEGPNGKITTPASASLDTGFRALGGLAMSSHYAKELGLYPNISSDFTDPCMRAVSGHDVSVRGILRNVRFRLKGTSVTFVRDFYVCDALDELVDIMIGASFIKEQFKLLFEKVKECFSLFGAWFSTKKESAKEKEERRRRELEQKIKARERELARLRREEERMLKAQQMRNQQQARS